MLHKMVYIALALFAFIFLCGLIYETINLLIYVKAILESYFIHINPHHSPKSPPKHSVFGNTPHNN